MVREDITFHHWRLDPIPAGVGTWPFGIGRLVTYGFSRRANIQVQLFPHLIVKGSGTFTNTYGEHPIEAGDMFFLWPGVPHEFWENPEDPWEFYWMRIGGDKLIELGQEWGVSAENPVLHTPSPRIAVQAMRTLYDYWGRRDRDFFEGLALFYQFITVTRKKEPPPEKQDRSHADLIAECTMTIEALMETGINVAELAHHLGVNRTTLWRAFQAEKGITPVEYLNQLRILRARTLLENTEHKIASIARMCGYHDEKYFLRCFRQSENTTPGQYRRKHSS
ncbi:MAG: AraC family transcriptional regulator [Candidatus Sumerlaeia bacterium]